MSYSDYLIKNCNVNDFESACPKHWDKLKPAFSDMVRHCDHCKKKVYLCETDEQIKFYSSVKFCIAVATEGTSLNVVRNTPSGPASISNAVEEPATQHDDELTSSTNRPVPNVWRRTPSLDQKEEIQHGEVASPSRKQQITADSDIPDFLRKRSK